MYKTKEKKNEYNTNYAKANLKRIPLNVRLDIYDRIKKQAELNGEPVNTYIKRLIDTDLKLHGDPSSHGKEGKQFSLGNREYNLVWAWLLDHPNEGNDIGDCIVRLGMHELERRKKWEKEQGKKVF
jgi:hypothetical protein